MSNIEHPAHYNLSEAKCKKCGHQIECIDVATTFDFDLGNTLKYLWRHQHKGGIESLKKAKFYLDYHITKLEKEIEPV